MTGAAPPGGGLAGAAAAGAVVAGSGVRILGPVVEPKPEPTPGPATVLAPTVAGGAPAPESAGDAPNDTDAAAPADTAAPAEAGGAGAAGPEPVGVDEPLVIVTLEDLQRPAEPGDAASASSPGPTELPEPAGAPEDSTPDGHGAGYGDGHE